MILSVVPKRWFSWDFAIQDATGQPVAEVRLSSWRERGAVIVNGVEHRVSRHGVLRGAFMLERDGSILARAEKPSAFRREFKIEHDRKQYTLKARSVWRPGCVLYEGDREIGGVIPDGLFSRRARVELPDDLSLVFRLFVVWLTLLLWRRDLNAAS